MDGLAVDTDQTSPANSLNEFLAYLYDLWHTLFSMVDLNLRQVIIKEDKGTIQASCTSLTFKGMTILPTSFGNFDISARAF